MDSELTEIIIPSIAFFVSFFLVFTLIELMIILFLNGFVLNHWGFVVDVVMRVKVRHGNLVRALTLTFITIFLILLFRYTAFLKVIHEASVEEKLYTAQIILVIFLTYIIATRQLFELTFLKQIHRYLYFYLSIIVFVLMVLLVHTQYENYQRLINAKIVAPIKSNIQIVLENSKRKHLLSEVRRMIHNNRCPHVDFTTEIVKGNPLSFMYVTTDPDLRLASPSLTGDAAKNYTIGRACTTENETFLLTDYGQWFWVIE